MGLRTRLVLSHSLIIVICLGIVALAVSVLLQGYQDRFARERLDDITLPIYVQARSLAMGRASLAEAWENLEEQSRRTGVYVILVDDQGKILRQAAPAKTLELSGFELPPEGLAAGSAKPYRGTYVAPDGQSFVFAAYTLRGLFAAGAAGDPEALVLAVPRRGLLALWSTMVRPFFWAGIIAFGVSIVIALLLARSFYRPIRRVTEAARQIARGEYDQKVPVSGSGELRELALSFNRMAAQVKLSQQRLRDFVADVSHELRSPLTSIRGFAQAMLDRTADDPTARLRAAQIIKDESRRIIGQVDELLELSRMQSGQIQMARKPVDVPALLALCQEIFTVGAGEKGVTLKMELGPLSPVVGDIDRLEQVFTNLLDNALKHSPQGGQVTVSASQPGPASVRVTVADSGPGIPPEQLGHVFERFYQASGIRTGTGLGLAIAREIVLAHGGAIEAASTPGKGTEFKVSLPVVSSIPAR